MRAYYCEDSCENLRCRGQAEAQSFELEDLAFPDKAQVPGRMGMHWYLEVRILKVHCDHEIVFPDFLENRPCGLHFEWSLANIEIEL